MRSPVGWIPVGLEASHGRVCYGIEIVGFEDWKKAEGFGRSPCC
ncbi:MAG: hypothetical protein ACRC8Y_18880 [Chroococcales cyanobacterium]